VSTPLVVLILGGVAERWGCPADESPLALAATPNLDRLAREGRVFGVRLVEDEALLDTAAPLLALLGHDPARVETARASYLARLHETALDAEECYVSADYLSLFRDLVADVEPGPFRAAESDALLEVAAQAIGRAGFRLLEGGGSHHLAIAPRESVDPHVPAPERLLGRAIGGFEPRVGQHAFAHRIAREALDRHEINEVRRDLGLNGADAVWLWGPGGEARLPDRWSAGEASALGTDQVWRGVARAAGLLQRAPNARSPAQLLKGLAHALQSERLVFVYTRRGVDDAVLRERRLRTEGVAELDRLLVGPAVEAVAAAGGRLLVVPDGARDSEEGTTLPDPVPAVLWGEGIRALSARPFTEQGAASAGDPLAPGHGVLAYVRHL